MLGMSPLQLFIVLFLFCVFLLPWIMALMSKKASGNTKLVWFLLSFFISWLGYFVYYFLVVKQQPQLPTE